MQKITKIEFGGHAVTKEEMQFFLVTDSDRYEVDEAFWSTYKPAIDDTIIVSDSGDISLIKE